MTAARFVTAILVLIAIAACNLPKPPIPQL
jgi:hypothetical protein